MNKKGFTLVELIVVIVIIAILVAIGIPLIKDASKIVVGASYVKVDSDPFINSDDDTVQLIGSQGDFCKWASKPIVKGPQDTVVYVWSGKKYHFKTMYKMIKEDSAIKTESKKFSNSEKQRLINEGYNVVE